MNRAGVVFLVIIAALAAGLFVPFVVKGRANQDRVYCVNNLRQLAGFVGTAGDAKAKAGNLTTIPAATLINPALPVDRRMSWVPATLLLFNQRRQETESLVRKIDPKAAWDAEVHQPVAKTMLAALVCPATPTPPAPYGITHYVGVTGLGPDAGSLPADSPRIGCFRYDAATPLADIAVADGLSQSMLFAETNADIGPWLRGGPSTARGLDDAAGAKPYIGDGGQLGGHHPGGANVAFADGGVKFLTDRTSPTILLALATVRGGPAEFAAD